MLLEQVSGQDIQAVYQGKSPLFRLLRSFGWGGSLNLGYFSFPSPFWHLNLLLKFDLFSPYQFLPQAQYRLTMKAIKLLGVKPGDRVLDIACGRGLSSFILSHQHPEASVSGVDLLPEHVTTANTLWAGNTSNLRIVQGDAMDLASAPESFDRILCLEASFHFSDRNRFLAECMRVLRPGGRLVIVDVLWASQSDREAMSKTAVKKLVGETWCWEDLGEFEEYRQMAHSVGFDEEATKDWTRRVTGPIQSILNVITWVGNHSWLRAILNWLHPLSRGISAEDWKELAQICRAHDVVEKRLWYGALVLRKPL